MHILRAKGKWSKPVSIKEIKITFYNESTGRKVKQPKKYRCEHPQHFILRKDRKYKYQTEEMYIQKWQIEGDILNTSISSIIPLEPRIICKYCYEYEINQ
jgi:hypothetical protein